MKRSTLGLVWQTDVVTLTTVKDDFKIMFFLYYQGLTLMQHSCEEGWRKGEFLLIILFKKQQTLFLLIFGLVAFMEHK